MSRFNLPEIEFVSSNPEELERKIISRVEELSGLSLSSRADPRRKFIQALVPVLIQQRNICDYTGKQNLLAYAEDDILNHIGETRSTPRNEPKKAMTTMRVTVVPSEGSLLIPAGTSFYAASDIFFETTVDHVIFKDETQIDVDVVCTKAGEEGNGYLPGQITTLVDPLPWVQSVTNVTESEGGADWEEDDPYAERIRQAPEGFSTAGPPGAYKYWANTANQLIVDVAVDSPSESVVEIRPLLKDGNIPGEEILQDVAAVFERREIKPLTDQVQVLPPETVSYDINVTYWVYQSDASVLSSIQTNVQKAIDEYVIWQKSKLGRSIDPSELIARMKQAGAKRVAWTSPQYVNLEKYQVAIEGNVTIQFGGMEDD